MHDHSATISKERRELLPVALQTLRSQPEVDFDLYLWPAKNRPAYLYRARHIALKPGDLQELLDKGITTVYTRSTDAEKYCDHVRQHVVADESIPVAERFGILQDATRAVLNDSLASRNVGDVLAVTADLGQDLTALICDRKHIMRDLLNVMTHDYSTFTHITNVCACCLTLAEAYGIRDQAQLHEIAQGALLHDIGKCSIPAAILNKAGKLTDKELEVIREHPQRGFEELCFRPEMTWGQLMMVYQHHERYDGRGYPMGLVGNEIHEWGRLCAVADVYDALTRDRPYRPGLDTKEVLEYMGRESGRSFDKEMTQCWMSTLNQCQK